ncbi:MAG TPA: metallopeptidase TldD-related protein [Jatrophihabitans sp.]|nr:metallopeptidase TldD-related protein [Jatrophihabitans sp.]
MAVDTGPGGSRIQNWMEQALALSAADGCVVVGEERTEANLRWAANSLTTNGQMRSRKLTVISMVDGPAGVSSGAASGPVTADDPAGALAALVAASEAAAHAAAPADDAAPLVSAGGTDPGWDCPPAGTGIEVFTDLAPALGAAFGSAAAAGQLLYGFAEHVLTSNYLASSTGLRRRFDQPTGRFELNGKTADLGSSAWIGCQTRDFRDIDLPALTADLDRRLGWSRTKIELPAGRYETLLPPSAVADLMLIPYSEASARDAEEGRSVYSAAGGGTRLGESLAALPLTLRSDPSEPGLQCAPFVIASPGSEQSVFDSGAEVPAVDWISRGKLANLHRNRNWAARTGTAFVPMPDNLIMTADGPDGAELPSLDQMIAGTERGLLLTCLWYIRQVDPQTLLVTGLTRDGVYLIERGEVRGVVNNFRFNESPVDLLGRITEIGATCPTLPREFSDEFTRAAMPPIRVSDFNMSTVSQAS